MEIHNRFAVLTHPDELRRRPSLLRKEGEKNIFPFSSPLYFVERGDKHSEVVVSQLM